MAMAMVEEILDGCGSHRFLWHYNFGICLCDMEGRVHDET